MSVLKSNTIEILNQLIPDICPQEQQIFELYSDALFEESITNNNGNRLGDESYSGITAEIACQFILGCVTTLLIEESAKGVGKYSWQKLRDLFGKRKSKFASKQSNQALLAALEKALIAKALAEEKATLLESQLQASASPNQTGPLE